MPDSSTCRGSRTGRTLNKFRSPRLPKRQLRSTLSPFGGAGRPARRLSYELQCSFCHELPFAVDAQIVARIVQRNQLLVGHGRPGELIGQPGAVGVDCSIEGAMDDQQGADDLRQQPLDWRAAA